MNILTKDIIKALEPAEPYFRQVSVGYKRNSTHALDMQVYEALKSVNPNEPKPNYSCPKCIFELYRRCGEIYNYSKEFYENEQMEKKNARQQPTNANSNATTATRQSSTRVKRKGKKNSSD